VIEQIVPWVILAVIITIPLYSLLTIYWFQKQPFIGSMWAALQVLVVGGAGAAAYSLEAKVKIAAVGAEATLNTGNPGSLTAASMFTAAVFVFGISAILQRDREKDDLRRDGYLR
jgi:hypothetical protein